VALSMSASPAILPVSNLVTFTVTVTNHGPSASSGVSVSNALPPSVVFVSAVAEQGTAMLSGSAVIWNVGSLTNNGHSQVLITVMPTVNGVIYNSARVSSATVDPNPDDDVAYAVAEVGPVSAPVMSGTVYGSGGVFQFDVSGSAGASYIVQTSTNLVDWLPAYTNISPYTFTDTSTTNHPSRFYRAVVGP
jgi:uncharacterized repeat protein (TIGR01451 family)